MIKKCLFPAAGYGTRFLPATKAIPKEMLPILTKPLLQYAVEEALNAGIHNMAIVTGRGKRSIEDHFDNAYELEQELKSTTREHLLDEIKNVIEQSTFTYVRQNDMLGLGHAILTGKPLIGNEPFAVSLADDLCLANNNILAEMKLIHEQFNCSIVAIDEVPFDEVHKYGIVDSTPILGREDICYVNDMIEKPSNDDAPSNLAIIGRYILTPDIFNILENLKPGLNGEIQLTDALAIQAKEGNVIAYKLKGKRFDCGDTIGYVEAINYFAKKQSG